MVESVLPNMSNSITLGAARLHSTDEAPSASMHEVVMQKQKLLQHLVENKAKHDVVLGSAIAGYWEIAKSKVAAKQTSLNEQVDSFKSDCQRAIDKINDKIDKKETLPNVIDFSHIRLDTALGLIYPEDHSKDYDRAIAMMEASIHDIVRLTVVEFDAYVLNNWEWKKNFLASNSSFIGMAKLSNKINNAAISGMSYTGALAVTYQRAAEEALTSYQQSDVIKF